MLAHGHITIVRKMLRNYGGAWTRKDSNENVEKW